MEFSEFISTYKRRLNIAVEQLAVLLPILKAGGFNLGLKIRGFWCFLRVPSGKYLSRISCENTVASFYLFTCHFSSSVIYSITLN